VLRAKDAIEQERLLRPLVERCSVAAFGVGRKTRYDSTVRDALQIKAEGGDGEWQGEQTAAEPLRGRTTTSMLFLSALKWA
jgi:hypothetical protein